MLTPPEHFLSQVQGHDDLFAFAIPMEAKAVGDSGDSVTIEDNGDLIIEGYAAVWEGDDREGENFVPGAFKRAAKAFLDAHPTLCFHHKRDQVLGRVEELEEDGKGLRMRARVDGAIKDNPTLGTYYHQIKNGTLRGLSVGGFFKRAIINGKQKIADMDFSEISVTGVPVHTGPSFAVVAGKALKDEVEIPEVPEIETLREADLAQINAAVEYLTEVFAQIEAGVSKRTTKDSGVTVE